MYLCISQVVCAANDLEEETDAGNFFAAYSQINNSLEQMFIELLLLMDGYKIDSKPQARAMVDLSGVIEALKAVTLQKQSEGMYVWVWGASSSVPYLYGRTIITTVRIGTSSAPPCVPGGV